MHSKPEIYKPRESNATLVTPAGTFIGRDSIGKYYGDIFQRFNPSGRVTKINYVYAFGEDLVVLGGYIVTVYGSRQGGGFLTNVYTPAGNTWKIRTSVVKYAANP